MNPRAKLAAMIDEARRVVVFTGAGVSTSSASPTSAAPAGLVRMKPIYFNEFVGSEARRREAWTRIFAGTRRLGRRQA